MSTGGGSGDLLQVLQLACSQDPDQLKVGERQLDEWKKQTGFYSGLAVSKNFDSYKLKLS